MFANSLKKGKIFQDIIFQTHAKAQARANEVGQDKVINGTVGTLISKGQIVTYQTVDQLVPKLDIKKISAYSPLEGNPDFLEAMEGICFSNFKPEKKIRSVAVPGGMGGITQAITNYTEIGDTIITSDWYWDPYDSIVEGNYRKLTTFELFEDNKFNIESFKKTVKYVASKQDSVFLLINSPANNPTGYSIQKDEWAEIITFLNSVDKKIILFLDVAYVEFAEPDDKSLFRQLDHLNSNILTIVGYSISKSLAKYGMRAATVTGIHEDENVLDEFFNVITISNRSTFGSVPSIGQHLTLELFKDKELFAEYRKEIAQWKKVMSDRAEAFLQNIDHEIITPYKNGFFISIKTDQPEKDSQKLMDKNIFLVPLVKGIRVGICSIEAEDLVKVAQAINQILSR